MRVSTHHHQSESAVARPAPPPPAEATPKRTEKEPPKASKAKNDTSYVILEAGRDGSWIVISNVTASSAKAAVGHALGGEPAAGMYVAVPERSWQPITVKVETQTVVKFD
jgi:hypothetical protein